MTDLRQLCLRLLQAIDSGNIELEEHVLCQIRSALAELEGNA